MGKKKPAPKVLKNSTFKKKFGVGKSCHRRKKAGQQGNWNFP